MTTPETPANIWLGNPITPLHQTDPSKIVKWANYIQQLAEASGVFGKASWAALQGVTPTEEGVIGIVGSAATGTHSDSTATGYDGATVDDEGVYAWYLAWGRWKRIAILAARRWLSLMPISRQS
ncbi:hypothetical protein Q4543_19465 [Salipiger sp. 1_MG-2023]|uniref:hypothetical protein n=1 Tax=Salipiger sp. 1_MG-2023 TaxID=3062665 RepID=UPI0026E13073|nr:hypothetical protein [Salipiger sp. 1_MG-2023]MDO6587694.1 hypothetical protein [Salipiger sp. 1_MG-2023]